MPEYGYFGFLPGLECKLWLGAMLLLVIACILFPPFAAISCWIGRETDSDSLRMSWTIEE